MIDQQRTHRAEPTNAVLAFTVFGRDYWLERLAAGAMPDFQHPLARRWGFHHDGRNVAIYLGRIYCNTGRCVSAA